MDGKRAIKNLFLTILAVFGGYSSLFAFECNNWKIQYSWTTEKYQECLKKREKIAADVCTHDPDYSFACILQEGRTWLSSDPGYLQESDRIRREYSAWVGDVWDWEKLKQKQGAYFMPESLLVCATRELFIKEFNRIQDNGGTYNPNYLEQGCYSLEKSNAARISKVVKDSNVVRIQYGGKSWVAEYWTHFGLLLPMSKHLKGMVK